jgi:glycosyltransferase involved in cell wall biosynthesis
VNRTKGLDAIGTALKPVDGGVFLSVIIPVYNEEDSIPQLHERLTAAVSALDRPYEIVYVDDGSTDGSLSVLQAAVAEDPYALVIQLRKNFGQTAAMSAGIDHSQGEIIVFMDADLQNDPADIPKLLAKIDEGYDLVSGWRVYRKDHWLWRRFPSLVANRLISYATGVRLRDYGCTLKAYRREILDGIRLYGEMHRFVPAYAHLVGATVAEIPVGHFPRMYGQSKYGLSRTFKVILDLFTVKFLGTFSNKPIYLFGGSGLILIGLSLLTTIGMIVQKILYDISMVQTPLLLLAAILLVLGFHSILLGLTAELLMRTYHESQGKTTYVIRRIIHSRE